jgi:hypothetical protein
VRDEREGRQEEIKVQVLIDSIISLELKISLQRGRGAIKKSKTSEKAENE